VKKIIFVVGIPGILFFSCTSPNYLASAKRTSFTLPFKLSFALPENDKRNGIESVFCSLTMKGNEDAYSITVVFKDEDYPNFFADGAYDLYRRFKYGREKDVETFSVNCDHASGKIISVDLSDVYSGAQDFRKKIVTHQDTICKSGNGDALLLYVNTWNHMFSLKDNNPSLEKIMVENFVRYCGNREEVERRL
jgi:hypothetical protein